VYLQQRKYPEAEVELRKQLEINPLDPFAHATLGRLYVRMAEIRRRRAGAAEVGFAVAEEPVAPRPARQGLSDLGEQADAVAAFDRAIEIDPSAWMWNDIAYELALKRADLPRALRYAESAVSATSAASRNFSAEGRFPNAIWTWSRRSRPNGTRSAGALHERRCGARAEPFVRAAGSSRPMPKSADHCCANLREAGTPRRRAPACMGWR
jgi:tetratricopeptide (TPR) repeat protein